MEKDIACFCKIKKIKNCCIQSYQYLCIKMCSPFAVFISIRRINCYMICLLNYSCYFIMEETYISNITSFPVLSKFMFANV